MAKPGIDPKDAKAALEAVEIYGSLRAAARATGMNFATIQRHYNRALKLGLDNEKETVTDVEPTVKGRVHALPRDEFPVPTVGVNRYIFTCAQNNTAIHEAVWENLNALATHYNARICISTFTYDKGAYGEKSVKRGKAPTDDDRGLWYAPEVEPHVLDEDVVVAPDLIWCGRMNILPTAVRPLSGMESYTGRYSGIFPHVKFALEPVSTMKKSSTKLNFTTGTVTQRNYIAKKAGMKAEFHHGYGALLVEVNSNGDWFCRQLNADSDGTIYDLDLKAHAGKVTAGHRVEAITWGDIHIGSVPADGLGEVLWGRTDFSMLDVLRPKYQFMHDVLDFRSRNHHERNNPHRRFQRYIEGTDGVIDELMQVRQFLDYKSQRYSCKTIVVNSNHDNAFERWLREADYRSDPKNALFFLHAQLAKYQSIAFADEKFILLEWAMQHLRVKGARSKADIQFLKEDESFIICPEAGGGIECGMHGHLGSNGSRPAATTFAKMGFKSNTGHNHKGGILDGAYVCGTSSGFSQDWNSGPSNWTHSHIVTYENGKRTIITCWKNQWRA